MSKHYYLERQRWAKIFQELLDAQNSRSAITWAGGRPAQPIDLSALCPQPLTRAAFVVVVILASLVLCISAIEQQQGQQLSQLAASQEVGVPIWSLAGLIGETLKQN